jgi:3D (Asp-Asp-Asp) domain-containing protein
LILLGTVRRLLLALALPLLLGASVDAAGRRAHPRRPKVMTMSATAYCHQGRTATGHRVRRGIVAADPRVLPLGTVVRITGPRKAHRGTYRVLDVGSAVKGREIDIYMPSCGDAKRFGRQRVQLQVLTD